MSRPWLLIVGVALACGSPGSKATSSPSAESDTNPTDLVRLSAVADATAVGPGQELTVAARLDVAPGWHIYWINPGESGLATEVSIDAPAGFEVGELQFPGPRRFESSGVVSYGYAETALVSARVSAPDSLAADSTFAIGAEWLACREECIRGKAHTQLHLPLATAEHPAAPANQILIEEHRRRLPRPLSELANARYDWRSTDGGHELILYVDGGQTVEFFPTRDAQTALVGQALVPGEGVGALHLSFRTPLPERIRGVLSAADTTSAYFFSIDLPRPAIAGEGLGEAPDFTLTDLDGTAHRLSAYRGKIVVLEWFNPGCPFVKYAYGKGPLANMPARELAKGDVVWLAINSGAPGKQGHGRGLNQKSAREFGMKQPVLLDESGTVGKLYGAKSTPHMFVIAPDGRLVYRGALDNAPLGKLEGTHMSYVEAALAAVRGGRAVEVAETPSYGCSVKYAD